MSELIPYLAGLAPYSGSVQKLTECVTDAIGDFLKPTHIRRIAKAEADAEVIKAQGEVNAAIIRTEGDVKRQELAARAQERISHIELQRQQNIESIILIAIDQIPEKVSEKPVDRDWTSYFFDQCKDVSNEEMQSIWARILAGEVANPGSFSLRTLNLVRIMRQNDAVIFQKVANYLLDGFMLFLGSKINEYLFSVGLNSTDLLQLESLGLFVNKSMATIDSENLYEFHYFHKLIRVKPRGDLPRSFVDFYPLSEMGRELLDLCDTKFDERFFTTLVDDLYNEKGLEVVVEP